MRPIVAAICVSLAAGGCARRDEDYSVAGLMKRLQDGDVATRQNAIAGLKSHGSEAKPAVELLTQALKDTGRNVRIQAIYALAAIGPDAETALPRLIETLKAPDGDVRLAGTYAVPAVGVRSTTALPAVKAVLSDRDPRVRVEAANGLRKLQVAARFKNSASTVSTT